MAAVFYFFPEIMRKQWKAEVILNFKIKIYVN